MNNKRRHSRLSMEMPVRIVTSSGKSSSGKTKDVSFSGILIEYHNGSSLESGGKCRVTLTLKGETNHLIEFNCEIVRATDSLVAVRFVSLNDDEYYEQYKNLLILSSPDPDRLLKELADNDTLG